MRVKKGDKVVVRTGKWGGQRGEVDQGAARDRTRSSSTASTSPSAPPSSRAPTMQAGIIDKFMPLHVSSVSLWCTKCDQPTRAGMKIKGDDTKVRVCRKCGAEL